MQRGKNHAFGQLGGGAIAPLNPSLDPLLAYTVANKNVAVYIRLISILFCIAVSRREREK